MDKGSRYYDCFPNNADGNGRPGFFLGGVAAKTDTNIIISWESLVPLYSVDSNNIML